MTSPKGLDHEKFAVSFQPGKIIVTPKDKGDIHYTLRLSGKSGTIDFHETITDADRQKRYRTLFSMRKQDLEARQRGWITPHPPLSRKGRGVTMGRSQ